MNVGGMITKFADAMKIGNVVSEEGNLGLQENIDHGKVSTLGSPLRRRHTCHKALQIIN